MSSFVHFIAAAGVSPPSPGLVSLIDTLSAAATPFARYGPICISDDGYTVFAMGYDVSHVKVWAWRWNGTIYANVQMIASTTAADFDAAPTDNSYALCDMETNADGSRLYVGVAPANSNQGVVLVFDETSANTWTQSQRILTPSSGAGYFGLCLAAKNGRLAIGEPYKSVSGGTYKGAVHIYLESGGTFSLEQTIDSNYLDTGSGATGIGNAVDFDSTGSVLLTAGSDYDPSFIGSGVISTYARSGTTWSYEDRVYPQQDTPDNFFSVPSAHGCKLTDDGLTAYIQPDVFDRVVKYSRSGGLNYVDKFDGPLFSGGYSPGKQFRISSSGDKFAIGQWAEMSQKGQVDIWLSEAFSATLVRTDATPAVFDNMGQSLDMTPDGKYVIWLIPQSGAPVAPVGDRVFMKVY